MTRDRFKGRTKSLYKAIKLFSEVILGTSSSVVALAKQNERANAPKEAKRLYKEFDFTAGMLRGALTEGRKKK